MKPWALGVFFHAGASVPPDCGAPDAAGLRPTESLQFVLAAGDGMAVQSRDPCQQSEASATVLTCEKADEEPSALFVGGGPEAVRSHGVPEPGHSEGVVGRSSTRRSGGPAGGSPLPYDLTSSEAMRKREGKVIIVGTWAK